MTLAQFKHKLELNNIPLNRPTRDWEPSQSIRIIRSSTFSPWFRAMLAISYPTKSSRECTRIGDIMVNNISNYMSYEHFYQSLIACNLLPHTIAIKEL